MKRITSLLASLALCCGLAAQTYKMHITRTDDTQTTDCQRINFLDGGRVAIVSNEWDQEQEQYRTDTIDAASLKTLDFLTLGGRKWELDYAHRFSDYRPNDYGYGSVMHMRDLMTEDVTAINSGYNWYSACQEAEYGPYYVFAYIPWFFYFESIILCNDAIKAIPTDAATDAEKAILAEVLTTRAMLYLDFARMYEFLPNERATGMTEKGINVKGLTVPIVDENTQDLGNGYYVPRASKADMVAFIRRDLDRAEELMPLVTETSHEIPHMDALYGLRARLALWNGDYADAATYATRAIELTATKPMTTEQLLSTTKGFNDISCWMWGVQQTEERNTNGSISNFTSWLSPEYDDGYASLVPPMVGRSFYEKINYADPRKLWFIAPTGSPLYNQIPLINASATFEPYTAVKFRPANGMTTYNDGGYFTAYPLMRVEEMYLIRAEATAYPNAAAARQLLTDFMRTYRYDTYKCKATDFNGILQEIILQKRIELWGEGQTFFDVKRLNLSVTRNYEGTNFYEASAFNTVGRPYWMNMQFPSNAAEKDPALYGQENPWENNESNPILNENLYLTAPTYLKTHVILPLDSIYSFMLTAQFPEGMTGTVTMEVSLSPTFDLGKTAAYTTLYLNEGLEQKPVVSASNLCQKMKQLLGGNGLPQSGRVTAYFRLLAAEAYSPALGVPILLPENYEGYYYDFSFAPHVTATSVGEIDCEQMAGEDYVKVVNLSIDGEGEFYSSYDNEFRQIGSLNFANRRGFYINAEGQCSYFNETALSTYNNVLNQSADAYTFGDGYVDGTTVRDGIICRFRTDSVAVSLRFNQQMIAEQKHTWQTFTTILMTSTFDPERTGTRVTIEQAADDETLFRLVAPYQQGHNLIYYQDTVANEDLYQNVKTTIWKNYGSLGIINWSGDYRFAPESNTSDARYAIPQYIWEKMKTETFYVTIKGASPRIRVTSGSWNPIWTGDDILPGNELLEDLGNDTYRLTVNLAGDPLVNVLDAQHLLFTGGDYSVEEIYFIDVIRGGYALTLPRQMASCDSTQGAVYVEGTGTYADWIRTFQLRFTGSGNTYTEQFGTKEVGTWEVEVWHPIGIGTYRDDFVTSIYSVENVAYPVEIEESNKGKIRLVNPYGAAYPYNDPGDFNPDETYYLTFDISDPYNVKMVPSVADLGMSWSYGMFSICHLSNRPGTFANGVVTFPEKAFYVAMSNYKEGNWSWYGNSHGLFAIALPGYEIPEIPVEDDSYSVHITSTIIESSDGDSIRYQIQLGEDLKWARYAFATSNNYLSICSDMEEGAGTQILDKNTIVTQKVTKNGQYYIIVIADDGKGRWNFELDQVEYVKQSWIPYATGTFYYNFFSDGDEPEADPGYTLYQNENNPETFKIGDWGHGASFIFTWDRTTNVCVVADQSTYYEYSSYGMMHIIEGAEYHSKYSEKTSYYDPETKTFHFFPVYYVSAGSFGQFEEVFEITEEGAVKHRDTRRINSQALSTRSLTKDSATRKRSIKASKLSIRKTDMPQPLKEKKETFRLASQKLMTQHP